MEKITVDVREWLVSNTFAPRWFPRRLHHPATAFGFAVGIQALAIVLTALLLHMAPDFSFRGALIIIGVVCTALTVGGAPGLIASFTGTLLLDFFLMPPFFSFSLSKGSDILAVLFYLAVCLSANLAATHVQRIHRVVSVPHEVPTSPLTSAPSTLASLERRLAAIEAQQQRLSDLAAQQSAELQAISAAVRAVPVEQHQL